MKTKFAINYEIFCLTKNLNEAYDKYEEYYKEDGWILDKETEDVFLLIDKEINLNVDDSVIIDFVRDVKSKTYDMVNDIMIYQLSSG